MPFRAKFGVYGSYVCAVMNFICLAAQFYVALWPVGGPNLDPTVFFQSYLAGPFLVVLYIGWKAFAYFRYPEQRKLYVKIKDIDIYTGMREGQKEMISGVGVSEDQRRASVLEIANENKKKGAKDWGMSIVRSVF